MCDTIVATGEVTADGLTVFGKNSDREPNEAHHLLRLPAADHAPGSRLECTCIDIPQVGHTHAVLLAKPFWIWGAEMGANEHGLVIGNEAVFTREPYRKRGGLTGMDLLRLALERAESARAALDVITELLSEHGQGGNCGFDHKLFYHNSFILADPHDAWVLETAGRHWAARRVRGVYAISNGLTIGKEFDLASPELVSHAVAKGWCKGPGDFDFARCYSDRLYTHFSDCRRRRHRATFLLASVPGAITPATMMAALRDHGGDPGWRPDRGLTGASVCMHAAAGPIRGSQTTGSMVSHLHPDHPAHFVTGTAAPCTGIFKPAWTDTPLPDTGPLPHGSFDPDSLFWRHERLHRAVLRDPATLLPLFREQRDTLETKFIERALEAAPLTPPDRENLAARCFAEADAAMDQWLELVAQARPQRRRKRLYSLAWKRFNRRAGMEV